MTKAFKPKIVSANDLLDGCVVYLDRNSGWTQRLSEAAVAASEDAAQALLAEADQPAKVVGPYLMDVSISAEGIRPDHFRERFRDTGPTLRADFARDESTWPRTEIADTEGNH